MPEVAHTGEHHGIAAPMVGGMVSSPVLTLVVTPAIYALVKQWELR